MVTDERGNVVHLLRRSMAIKGIYFTVGDSCENTCFEKKKIPSDVTDEMGGCSESIEGKVW